METELWRLACCDRKKNTVSASTDSTEGINPETMVSYIHFLAGYNLTIQNIKLCPKYLISWWHLGVLLSTWLSWVFYWLLVFGTRLLPHRLTSRLLPPRLTSRHRGGVASYRLCCPRSLGVERTVLGLSAGPFYRCPLPRVAFHFPGRGLVSSIPCFATPF